MLKKIFNNILYLIIVVLVVIIFLQRSCTGGKKVIKENYRDTVEVIRWDTITKTIPSYIPKYYTLIDTIYIPKWDTLYINQPIDTAKILKDYFRYYAYQDTLKNDTVQIFISDTISRNKILKRGITYNIKYPTREITITEYINPRNLYLGLGLGGNQNGFNYIGTELLYRGKNSQAVGLGIGLNENFNLALRGSFYWKILGK